MRYAGIIKNDLAAGPGLCVTFFTQGCPHRCPGCHNPETWDYEGGLEFYSELINEITEALTANGIHRNFCIMGGEPLCPENEFLTMLLIIEIRNKLPDVPIYIWSGYTIEELMRRGGRMLNILKSINFLIDGPYIEELKDTTLAMRGSSNQRIINMKKFDFSEKL
jgi:anaerobic ribonucleoside-triphosphate reductase activating protein